MMSGSAAPQRDSDGLRTQPGHRLTGEASLSGPPGNGTHAARDNTPGWNPPVASRHYAQIAFGWRRSTLTPAPHWRASALKDRPRAEPAHDWEVRDQGGTSARNSVLLYY